MNRQEFMEFFRQDDFQDHMTADDCTEIFMGILKGSSDFTPELMNELFDDYGVDLRVATENEIFD